MNGIKHTISSRLKEARQKRGLSRDQLITEINNDPNRPHEKNSSDCMSLEFETYRRWEDGTNKVNYDWMPILCKHLQCDVGYLFGEYNELTYQKANIHLETGLSETAIEVLQSLHTRSLESTVAYNIIQTVNMMLEHADERKTIVEVVPFLETISAYLNCAPEDSRIISVETDGSVRIFANRDSFENEPGEAISGDYVQQIVKTRLEQRVMDEVRNLWKEKNGESRLAFHMRMIEEGKKHR